MMINNYDVMKLIEEFKGKSYQEKYINELSLRNIQAMGEDETTFILGMMEIAYQRGVADALERAKNIPITWD
jgi:hypothetical protein